MRYISKHKRKVLVQVVVIVPLLSFPTYVPFLLHPITIFILIFLVFILVSVIAIVLVLVPWLSARLPSRTRLPRPVILGGWIILHILLPMLLPIFTSLPAIVSLKLAIITTAVVIVGVSVITPPFIKLASPSVVGLPALVATSIGIRSRSSPILQLWRALVKVPRCPIPRIRLAEVMFRMHGPRIVVVDVMTISATTMVSIG